MKTIYKVQNKVFEIIFETKKSAEYFLSKNSTGATYLTLQEIPLMEDSDLNSIIEDEKKHEIINSQTT